MEIELRRDRDDIVTLVDALDGYEYWVFIPGDLLPEQRVNDAEGPQREVSIKIDTAGLASRRIACVALTDSMGAPS